MIPAGTRIIARDIPIPAAKAHWGDPPYYVTATIGGTVMPRVPEDRPTRDATGHYWVQPAAYQSSPVMIHETEMEVVSVPIMDWQ